MRARALALLTCWSLGCSDCDGPEVQRPTRADEAAALQKAQPGVATGAERATGEPGSATPSAEPARPVHPRTGWSAVSIEDEVPLCFFAGHAERHAAEFVDQVESQELRANASVVIGAFAAWCVNEACDARPSLQCSVSRDGNTLVVRSRYWGERKDGATCEGMICRPITASCETPALEPGRYTVAHGDERVDLRIPSLLRSPCIGTEPRPAPKP